MLVPLTAIVTSSLPLAAAMALCAKDRKTVNKNKSDKSSKSAKGAKSGKSSKSGKAGKSGKSSRKGRSGSKRSSRSKKSSKTSSKKSSKSSKSKKVVAPAAAKPGQESKSERSEKSEASTKTANSKSSKGSKKSSKSRRLDADAQKKLASSAVETKSAVESVATIKHSTTLAVAPARLQYATVGGVNQIELKNTSNERKAYKVKCSDNALYRVNPVYGFADPKSSVKIDVLRLNGEEKTDKLVLLTANAKESADPRQAFNNAEEPREMMVVPLVAA